MKSPEEIAGEIRVEIRSIIRQFEQLQQPLKAEIEVRLDDQVFYRIEGIQSAEEMRDRVHSFAGSVWHLKDRLKSYVRDAKLELRDRGEDGVEIPASIESAAKKSKALMICADLVNAKKHGENKNRSGFSPKLRRVRLLGRTLNVEYDGATPLEGILSGERGPIECSVEVVSGDDKYSFGDAIKLIVTAFHYWLPLLRQLHVLSQQHPETELIVGKFRLIEVAVMAAEKERESWQKVTDDIPLGRPID